MFTFRFTLKIAVFLMAFHGLVLAEESANITSEYDKFEDKTTVKLKDMPVGDRLQVQAYFTYEGDAIKGNPQKVNLIFISQRNRAGYADSNPLIFILDDKDRVNIGNIGRTSSVMTGYSVTVLELMQASIPIKTFIKMANSQKIEGKLFDTVFSFNESQINALRSLLNYMPDR